MNTEAPQAVTASMLTSVVTALGVVGLDDALTDVKKGVSVLILAMLAEVGRRAASFLWSKFKP